MTVCHLFSRYLPVAGILLLMALQSQSALGLPAVQQGVNLADCVDRLSRQDGGWCEIRVAGGEPSISSVWPARPADMPSRLHMVTGPQSILTAWNSAALDRGRGLLYFMGGGHADYGGNEVYEFDLDAGRWSRLTDPSPLDRLFVARDYGKSAKKPWRRLCWMQDVEKVPAAVHTYDGLVFSHRTSTLFLYAMNAANGACFDDKDDRHRDDPAIHGKGRRVGLGWYEFNPSRIEQRNGLAPLAWRRVFDREQLTSTSIGGGYPLTAELGDGRLVFGSRIRTVVYDPTRPDPAGFQAFSQQADWGDGLQIFDKGRELVWSLHKKVLLAYDADSGKLVRKIDSQLGHGKSLAINQQGLLVSWDGTSEILVLDPDDDNAAWRLLDWSGNGPSTGNSNVYEKWVYLDGHDVFAGITSHKTGVWVYRHPTRFAADAFSTIDLQAMVDQAVAGGTLTLPPGMYGTGLYIDKSLTLNLAGVDLRGIARNRAVINVKCDQCRVVLQDFVIDGRKAKCLGGNCAGVKAEGRSFDLTLRRGHINNTVIGILTDNRGGQLSIEDSLVENTGYDDASTTLGHGVYAGKIDRLAIRRSRILRPFGDGHIVKSRATDTLIEDSVVAGIDGYQSRTIDFPCGGTLTVNNSTLQHSENADNNDLISVGTEPRSCGNDIQPSSVTLRNNWIIVDRDRSLDERSREHGPSGLFNWRAPVERLDVVDNRIVEPTGELLFSFQETLPDMMAGNQRFNSRKAAGLGPDEIPGVSRQVVGADD